MDGNPNNTVVYNYFVNPNEHNNGQNGEQVCYQQPSMGAESTEDPNGQRLSEDSELNRMVFVSAPPTPCTPTNNDVFRSPPPPQALSQPPTQMPSNEYTQRCQQPNTTVFLPSQPTFQYFYPQVGQHVVRGMSFPAPAPNMSYATGTPAGMPQPMPTAPGPPQQFFCQRPVQPVQSSGMTLRSLLQQQQQQQQQQHQQQPGMRVQFNAAGASLPSPVSAPAQESEVVNSEVTTTSYATTPIASPGDRASGSSVSTPNSLSQQNSNSNSSSTGELQTDSPHLPPISSNSNSNSVPVQNNPEPNGFPAENHPQPVQQQQQQQQQQSSVPPTLFQQSQPQPYYPPPMMYSAPNPPQPFMPMPFSPFPQQNYISALIQRAGMNPMMNYDPYAAVLQQNSTSGGGGGEHYYFYDGKFASNPLGKANKCFVGRQVMATQSHAPDVQCILDKMGIFVKDPEKNGGSSAIKPESLAQLGQQQNLMNMIGLGAINNNVIAGAGASDTKKKYNRKPARPPPVLNVPCRYCERKFATQHGMRSHSARCHPDLRHYDCPLCSATYNDPYELSSHMSENHVAPKT